MQFFSVPLMFLFFAVCIFFIRSVHVLKKGKGIAASVLLAGLASSVGEAVNQLPEQKSPSQNVGKMFLDEASAGVNVSERLSSTESGGNENGLEFLNSFDDLNSDTVFQDKNEVNYKNTGKIRGRGSYKFRGRSSAGGIFPYLRKKGLIAYAKKTVLPSIKKNSKLLSGILSAVAWPFFKVFYLFRNKIRSVGLFDSEADVEGMAEDCSQWYAYDKENFAGNIKYAEFYQLYSAYKVGYNGLLFINESEKKDYKNTLLRELLSRLSAGGEVEQFLRKRMRGGVEIDIVIKETLRFIEDLLNYDPIKSRQVPVLFCLGIGGTGKSKLADHVYELLSGCKNGAPQLNVSGKDATEVEKSISGSAPSYQGSHKEPQAVALTKNINKKYTVILMDEIEKQVENRNAQGPILKLITNKYVTWNFDNQPYPVTYGVIATSNFQSHQLSYSLNYLVSAIFGSGSLEGALNAVRQKYIEDLKAWGGDPMYSRAYIAPVFVAPLRKSSYEMIEDDLFGHPEDKTNSFSVKYSDTVSKDEQLKKKVLKNILEKIQTKAATVDTPGRVIFTNARDVVEDICKEKFPHLNLNPSHVVILDWDEKKNTIDIKFDFKK